VRVRCRAMKATVLVWSIQARLAEKWFESVSVRASARAGRTPTGTLPDGTYTAQAFRKTKPARRAKAPRLRSPWYTHAPVVSIDPVASPTKDFDADVFGGCGLRWQGDPTRLWRWYHSRGGR